jgi:uncharacterized DUF497 family protein
MQLEFDAAKNQINIATRGLNFERAVDFDFGTAIVDQDTRKAYPEPRFVAVGFLESRLHVLCFTPITGGIRVISFRKANAREVRDYDQTRATD